MIGKKDKMAKHSKLPGEGLVQQGFFQLRQRGELSGVEGFQALGFGGEGVDDVNDILLFS